MTEDVVGDADLLRIQELPADEYGGASGEKRKFQLEFLGKAPSERFPYTVANEVVSSHIGNVLGFNVPPVLPYRIGGEPLAMVLWMQPAARQQTGPPMTSRALKEFVESHDEEIHGAIVLDLYLANTDRSFGPERRNIAIDETDRITPVRFRKRALLPGARACRNRSGNPTTGCRRAGFEEHVRQAGEKPAELLLPTPDQLGACRKMV